MVATQTQEKTASYRALVLGPFSLQRDGVADPKRWQRRVEVLFKLLATAPDRQRTRDELIDLLWPDAELGIGSGNLRMLVHRLRLTLGGDPPSVLSEHGWIALNPLYRWELDLEELETVGNDPIADIAALERAAALYRGEPLIEDRYEDWAVSVRERAQGAWRRLCFRLASMHGARGSYDDAVRWLERLLTDDPLDEEAIRALLRQLRAAGRPADALRRFRFFEERLATELDVPPAAETASLVAELQSQLEEPSAAQPTVSQPALPTGRFLGAVPETRLIDRANELERVFFAVDAVKGGAGRALLLAGEPGVGKTRLAQEIMLRLREADSVVAAATGHDQYRSVPYYPFLSLLSQIYAAAPASVRIETRERSRLEWFLADQTGAEPEPPTDDAGEQLLTFRAIAGFLTAVARERPVALLLDDLHRADDGSLELFQYLARQMRGHRVLLLGTYRDGDVSREHPLAVLVRDLIREGLLERVPLPRLDPEATATMVAETLGEAAGLGEFDEFVYRRTRGNPFFIERLLRPLGGRYRLVRQIGSGSTGRVFEAVDERTGDAVAVKVIFSRREADPMALLRLRQEAAMLAALDHPNIVKVRDAEVDEYAGCIVMDLLEGRPLRRVLAETDAGSGLSLARVKHLLQQVAAALTFAHEHGIIHRDIKPDNIVVDAEDHVTVTDFGIARLERAGGLSTLTSTGVPMGTPLYMAPEQIEGQKVDARADIYALGAVMYEIVAGHPPFEGEDLVSVAYKHVHEPTPPLWHVGSPWLAAVPEDWEAVIAKALAKEPAQRFQTAAAMDQAIAALTTDEGAAPVVARRDVLPLARERTAPVTIPQPPAPRRWGGGVANRAVPALVVAAVVASLLIGRSGLFAPGHTSHAVTAIPLHGPTSVTVDRRDDVYVVDQGNDRVLKLGPNGRTLAAWGSRGSGLLQFNSPSDITVARDATIYVSDSGNKRVEPLRSGKQVEQYNYDVGAVALDGRGALYATDYGRYQILKISLASGDLLASLPIPWIEAGSRPFPAGIAVDGQGFIYVADREHSLIRKLSPTGRLLASIGASGSGPGQLNHPSDVAVDGRGHLYVADTENNRIQELSATGAPLRIWRSRSSGPGQFQRPVGVAVDASGNVYVAGYFDERVLKLSPSGRLLWSTSGLRPTRS